MISFIQVIDVIRTFAQGHLQLQKFDFEFREQMPNLATVNEAYPMLYVVPVGTSNIQFGKEFELDIYCVDRYKKDRSNVSYVISDTELILSDLSVYLENQTAFDSSYGSTTPINNDLLDYVGGHVMRVRVTVEKQALCELPFDGEQPTPPICPSALVRNSDDSWSEIVPSGATYVLPDAPVTVRNVSGDEVGSGNVPSVTGGVITVPDCPISGDGTAVLKDTDGNVLSTTPVAPETTEDIIAPDATIENSDATFTDTVASGGTLVLPDETINITDEGGTIIDTVTFPVYTPVNIDIESYCPPAVTRSTATIMKTGQTTSYRTGDDGDIQAGRDDDFFTLNSAPVHNDGSPTINTTTNRFTDINGLQVYGDNIVLDWSTWNGSTLLGYHRKLLSSGGIFDFNWNDAIDLAASFTNGIFTTGWRLWNRNDINNVVNAETISGFAYIPFSNASGGQLEGQNIWSSTTVKLGGTNAWFTQFYGRVDYQPKTNTKRVIAVRTFSLSTSNILS